MICNRRINYLLRVTAAMVLVGFVIHIIGVLSLSLANNAFHATPGKSQYLTSSKLRWQEKKVGIRVYCFVDRGTPLVDLSIPVQWSSMYSRMDTPVTSAPMRPLPFPLAETTNHLFNQHKQLAHIVACAIHTPLLSVWFVHAKLMEPVERESLSSSLSGTIIVVDPIYFVINTIIWAMCASLLCFVCSRVRYRLSQYVSARRENSSVCPCCKYHVNYCVMQVCPECGSQLSPVESLDNGSDATRV